jgi:hypothetical protein
MKINNVHIDCVDGIINVLTMYIHIIAMHNQATHIMYNRMIK